ncbi:MAG: hypothetical protein UY78_C0012G0014 [Parcubacteria group bacterium GW2011_GWA1_53_13]|nr:MAG: hypothetical protein UY78_C0012G0014 [Parcubacteria group bacterium GW2011_GWA1_53_13]
MSTFGTNPITHEVNPFIPLLNNLTGETLQCFIRNILVVSARHPNMPVAHKRVLNMDYAILLLGFEFSHDTLLFGGRNARVSMN